MPKTKDDSTDDANLKDKATIAVVIVDDDPIVRASLATILSAEADIVVSGEGGDGEEAIERYSSLLPDILLMDIQMPGTDGISAAERIIDTYPQARIVFLTTFSDDEYIIRALRLGARGYLIKQEVASLVPALKSVMAGHMVLGGEVMGKVDALVDEKSAESDLDDGERSTQALLKLGLSEREAEITSLISQGLDNKEIAQAVFISEGTVRNHVSLILQKLGLRNRTQIAVYYYQQL